MFRGLLIALAVACASAFAPVLQQRTETKLYSEVDRRAVLSTAIAGILGSSLSASALDTIPKDNEIIKEQRQRVDALDINNSPVADYMKMPGMYPAIGGKIANSGPFASVKDVYKILTPEEKKTFKKYEKFMVATKATGLDPLRGRDPYRSSFNQFAQVRSE